MQIILASQSPRRRELLTMMGLSFDVIVSHTDETLPNANMQPENIVKYLAEQKARAVFQSHPDACVIGSDTIVVLKDGTILGKPKDNADAFSMLSMLQGTTHTVYTGVALLSQNAIDIRHSTTEVTFSPMSKEEIQWYVDSGEPLDKAGSYGIQGPGGMFVDHIHGDYFTVIGMPVSLLYRMLKQANIF